MEMLISVDAHFERQSRLIEQGKRIDRLERENARLRGERDELRRELDALRYPPKGRCESGHHAGPLIPQPKFAGWLGPDWVRCEACRSHIAAPETAEAA